MQIPYIDLYLLVPAVIGLLAIVFSIFVILSRNLVYSATHLSLLGLMVASLIAILGYAIVAILHIIIYIGAGVLFIIMSVSMIREVQERRANRLGSLIVAIISSSPIFYLAFSTENPQQIPPSLSDYSLLSRYISQSYWLPALLVFLSLSVALMAAVSITRGRGGR
ncbi:MAG: NADH-quinone oxidoreductase subunit J [Desulfurococcales archaeon]|jgi:NADH-quinone oxidoreductase subunit J|nr:NADH-quinone oxidoreductase subunit J [Desulfurococcales archaeon]